MCMYIMKICVNIVGQPRHELERFKYILDNLIYSRDHEFTYIYTTWVNENTDEFKKTFNEHNISIYTYDLPSKEEEDDIYKRIRCRHMTVDPTNAWSKTTYNFILALFILKKSAMSLLKYSNTHKCLFDLVITIRPDANIYNGSINTFYTKMSENLNNMYVAQNQKHNIYPPDDSYPDACFAANFENMIEILCIFDHIHKCGLTYTPNVLHPETSKWIYSTKILKLNIVYLEFDCFI